MEYFDIEKLVSSLESLTASDRDWIIGRLNDEEKRKLDNHLNAINGISDSSSANANDKSENMPFTSIQSTASTDAIEILTDARLDLIQKVIASEPAWIQALLLQDREWPWAAQYLADLNREKISNIQKYISTSAADGPNSLKRAVIELIKDKYCKLVEPKEKRSYFDQLLDQANQIRQRSFGINTHEHNT